MTFEDWWKKPVVGATVSKSKMAKHVKVAMECSFGESLDFKIAMKSAFEAGQIEGVTKEAGYIQYDPETTIVTGG